jgi:hypothetical protein
MSEGKFITGTYSSNGLLVIKAVEREKDLEEIKQKLKK